MLPVFITSNQIPLHVHAVFCQLHVHCIHLARGMMRMRIPSNFIMCCVNSWHEIASFPVLSRKHNAHARKLLTKGKAWSETSREVDVG